MFELTWMSIAGLMVGTTSSVIRAPFVTHRATMSLRFDPMMKRSIGVPMRRAYQPASTLPKLPVGTANVHGRPTESCPVT